MSEEKLIWERDQARYANGFVGLLGKYKVFYTVWIGGEEPHRLYCRLPGLRDILGEFKNEQDTFEYAENALQIWLKGAGLE